MAKGINRAKLNEAVAKTMDCSKAQADRAVGAVLEGIQRGLKKAGEVSIVGFGTFRVKQRAARLGRNPRTGEQIKIKASKTIGFKPGKTMKDSL